VVTINISIGHDDDLVITDLGDIEVLTDARADSGNHVADFGVLEDALFTGFFNVKDFATKRQDGLGFTITAVLSGAAGGITLDDVEFAFLRIFARAIG
jgi:hypothetical protein